MKVKRIQGLPIRYRPGTTDEKVIVEVIEKRHYRKPRLGASGFDVEFGERWLDLGANIGSFGIYCKIQGATAVCYEPEPNCFALLEKNVPDFQCINAAVTDLKSVTIPFFVSNRKLDHYRGSRLQKGSSKPIGTVPNVWAGTLKNQEYDGIKMDIEGSELGLIDQGLIPKCRKLVMEYHTSYDQSMSNLRRRLDALQSQFDHIHYYPEYDRLMALGGFQKPFHDRVVFCWND